MCNRGAWVVLIGAAIVAAGCGEDVVPSTSAPRTTSASGNAFSFPDYTRMQGAQISVLEIPGATATTDEDGYFLLSDLPAGAEATFVIKMAGYPETQTKTFTLPETPLERVTFQVPSNAIFELLAQVIRITPDPTKCQIVTTVTRIGKSIYDEGAHGEDGATVAIEPALSATQGPIYFNDQVIPNPALTQTSSDGGVLYTNVVPGEYTLTASKPGATFEPVHMKCRANVLVNASPPYGLQRID